MLRAVSTSQSVAMLARGALAAVAISACDEAPKADSTDQTSPASGAASQQDGTSGTSLAEATPSAATEGTGEEEDTNNTGSGFSDASTESEPGQPNAQPSSATVAADQDAQVSTTEPASSAPNPDPHAGPVTVVDPVPGWEGGVPDPAFDWCNVNASYRPLECRLTLTCDMWLLLVMCADNDAGVSSCACVFADISSDSELKFADQPYPGDDLDPCVSAMEVCVAL